MFDLTLEGKKVKGIVFRVTMVSQSRAADHRADLQSRALECFLSPMAVTCEIVRRYKSSYLHILKPT